MNIDRFSVCNFTLMSTPFEAALDAIADNGIPGVGVCEALIPEGWSADRVRSALDTRGLAPTVCIPALLSPLPLVLFPGPDDPAERERGLAESIRLFGALGAEAVAVLTGPQQARSLDDAEDVALPAIARLADVAAEAGTTLALEPIYKPDHEDWSLVWDIPGAMRIVDAIDHPALGILVDAFHLWDTEDFHDWIRRAGSKVHAVHLHDRGSDTRSWADRRVPGTGVIDLAGMIRACEDAGYRGHYDCEIFSDSGLLGVDDYPDSLWKLPPTDLVAACAAGFLEAVEEAEGG